jgi:hypothetical protein
MLTSEVHLRARASCRLLTGADALKPAGTPALPGSNCPTLSERLVDMPEMRLEMVGEYPPELAPFHQPIQRQLDQIRHHHPGKVVYPHPADQPPGQCRNQRLIPSPRPLPRKRFLG